MTRAEGAVAQRAPILAVEEQTPLAKVALVRGALAVKAAQRAVWPALGDLPAAPLVHRAVWRDLRAAWPEPRATAWVE